MQRLAAAALVLALAAGATGFDDPEEREALARRQRVIEHHLLRVQRERFEASARQDPADRLRRLDREFRRTQQRRLEAIKAQRRPDGTD